MRLETEEKMALAKQRAMLESLENNFLFPDGCIFPEGKRENLLMLSAENIRTPYDLCGFKSSCNDAQSLCAKTCESLMPSS